MTHGAPFVVGRPMMSRVFERLEQTFGNSIRIRRPVCGREAAAETVLGLDAALGCWQSQRFRSTS